MVFFCPPWQPKLNFLQLVPCRCYLNFKQWLCAAQVNGDQMTRQPSQEYSPWPIYHLWLGEGSFQNKVARVQECACIRKVWSAKTLLMDHYLQCSKPHQLQWHAYDDVFFFPRMTLTGQAFDFPAIPCLNWYHLNPNLTINAHFFKVIPHPHICKLSPEIG